MNHNRFTAAALFGLALAACSKPAEPNNAAINNDAAAPNSVETIAPSESVDTSNAGTEAGNATPPAALPTAIPAQFQGRWGLNGADCTSTRGDAKGLLTIDGKQLKFYESRGTLDHVLGATATTFDARYGFAGEGQSWMRTERFTLAGDKLQRRTDAEPGQEPPVNLTYGRC